MKYDLKKFAFVTELDGKKLYRSIENPKLEIEVGDKIKKLTKKIKNIKGDVRPKKAGE